MTDQTQFPTNLDAVCEPLQRILDLLIPPLVESGMSSVDLEALVAETYIKHVRAHYGIRERKAK